MAEDLSEILDEIQAEADLHTELDELESNTSLVAFWTFAKQVFALFILEIKKLFAKHKEEVEALIDTTEVGGIEWYLDTASQYQHGDSLVIQNNRLVYLEVDPDLQIVKRVSIKEDPDLVLQVRVVKEVAGDLIPLDATEHSGFSAYMNRKKVPGTALDIQTLEADVLKLTATIELDPILYTDAGELISSPGTFPVEETISNYLKNFDFGGTFYISKLIDQVMEVEGVDAFYIASKTLNDISFTYKVDSNAGHIALDDTSILTYVLL